MRALRFLLFGALLIAVPVTARAQSSDASAQDVESARAAFQQGIELRDKQRNYPAAIEKLKAAYALVPTPRIAYELGKTYRQSGDLLNARAMFLEIDRLPARTKESEEAKKARADARAQADELEKKIPTLVIRVIGEGEVRLTLDEQEVSRETLAAPRKVNPGAHALSLQIAGRPPATRQVTVLEGEQKELEIKLPRPNAPNVSTNTGGDGFQTTSYQQTTTRGDGLHTALIVTAGVGLTVGLISGAYAISVASDAAKKCTNNVCGADALSGKNDATALAWTANITIGIGAAAFLAWLIIPPLKTTQSTTLGLGPMPGGAFASAQGRF